MSKKSVVQKMALWGAAATLGTVLGLAMAPPARADTCERDVCSTGIFWDSCEDNWRSFGCNVTGWNSCETYHCEFEMEG